MKKILINLTDSYTLELIDDDNTELSEYTKELSSVLQSNTVTILELSTGHIIIRPNKVLSIQVTEETKKYKRTPIRQNIKATPRVKKENIKKQPIEEQEDMITDGDWKWK